MAFAEVNGVRIFYTDDGQGDPPLLLLHGWTCDSLDYSWQIEPFAAHHRVVAIDLRGHGRSSFAPAPDLRLFTEDVATLVQSLELGPVVVVGHSLSGAIASQLAVEYPYLVQALVTIDPAVGLGPAFTAIAQTVGAQLSGPQANEFLVATWVAMEGPASESGLAVWHRRRCLGVPWEFLSEVWAAQETSGLMDRAVADEYLRRRRCPVLTIYVDQERADWEATTFCHPYSRALAWEGSGHWLHQERPLEFNRLVLDWLAGLDDGAALQMPELESSQR